MIKKIIILLSVVAVLVIIIFGYAWWQAAKFQDAVDQFVAPVANNSVATTTIDLATVTSTSALATSSEVAPVKQDDEKPVASVKTLLVPFTTQAPLAEWSDPRQQDGCEEAAVLMAMAWAQDFSLDKAKAKKEILAMSYYQEKLYGNYVDTNAEDTLLRLIKGYWNYTKAEFKTSVTKQGLINYLRQGQLVLAPTNGRALHNPNFKAPGPMTHMVVIKGYDIMTDEFITNDPGTRKGENYRYTSSVLLDAIVDYPTGHHLEQDKNKQAIIIISR